MATVFHKTKTSTLFPQTKACLKNKDYPDVLNQDKTSSVDEIKSLMWGYLTKHKSFSQRKLATRIVKDLKNAGIRLSLESVQRIFGKEAKKAPLALKQILIKYFLDDGFKNQKEIFEFCKTYKEQTQDEFSLIPTESVNQLVQLWLSYNLTDSKRTLSQILKQKLDEKGYEYNLGSLQNVLSYKVNETKKVVYLLLKDILIQNHFSSEEDFKKALQNLDPKQFEKIQLVSSEKIVAMSEEFLAKNPKWTKRKLAIQLSHDLKKKQLNVSFNSLQHILSGKRKVAKKIMALQLEEYLKTTPNLADCPSLAASASTRLPKRNLKKILNLWENTEDEVNQERMKTAFYTARLNEIKRVYTKRQKKKLRRLRKKAKPLVIPEYLYTS